MATYTGNSIVDYLASTGKASDFNSRSTLAQQYGISNYTGTAQQNTQLLNSLRGGQTSAPAPQAPAQGTVFPNGLPTYNYTPSAIPSSVIGTNAVNIPAPINNQTAQNNLAVTADSNTQPLAVASTQTPELNTADSIKQALVGLYGEQAKRGDFTLQAQNDAGLTEKRQALADINAEALTTKRSYENQIKKLRENNQGTFGGALENQVGELTRKANEDLANIGIRQQVAQGNLDSALKIIDDKVKAKFEPLDNQISTLEKLFTIYQNDMTESEKMQAQAKIDEKKSTLQTLNKAYGDVLGFAAQNGAPQSVLQAIDAAASKTGATAASIYAAAGKYAIDPLQRAQIANINSQISDRSTSQGVLSGALLTDAGKPLNDAQSTSYGYAERMRDADSIIKTIGSQFTGASSYLGQYLPNIAKSAERQQFEQAQRNFINAVLRKESGAVISEDEFANARKQYFPQPGDTSSVLNQKEKNREAVIRNNYRSAGFKDIPQNVQTITRPEDLRTKYNY